MKLTTFLRKFDTDEACRAHMRERRECGSADLGDGRLTAEFQGN